MPPYDLGEDDDVGALMDVGAVRRRGVVQVARRMTQTPASLRARPALMSAYPGAPPVAEKDIPLGFGNQAFSSTSGTTLTFTARPQAVFRGRRLVIDSVRSGATGGLVTMTSLLIGTRNQLVGTLGIPISAFAGTAFGVDMALDPAVPGIDITITLVISAAPGTTDLVTCGVTIIGKGIQ